MTFKGSTQLYLISIHAPVKGATLGVCYIFNRTIISIHAPVKGATLGVARGRIAMWDFNPRSREGSDIDESRLPIHQTVFQSTLP